MLLLFDSGNFARLLLSVLNFVYSLELSLVMSPVRIIVARFIVTVYPLLLPLLITEAGIIKTHFVLVFFLVCNERMREPALLICEDLQRLAFYNGLRGAYRRVHININQPLLCRANQDFVRHISPVLVFSSISLGRRFIKIITVNFHLRRGSLLILVNLF